VELPPDLLGQQGDLDLVEYRRQRAQRVTDATGITTFAYDKMNRQIRKTLPDNTQLRYDYDHNGSLSGYTDGGGQVGYTYNQVNLLTEPLEPGADTPVRFGYDSDNRRTTTTAHPACPTPAATWADGGPNYREPDRALLH
jgi:YD repeat-containing protein